MRLVRVPGEAGVVALGQRGHPPVAVVRLELVLEGAPHPVGLVQEEGHCAIVSGARRREPRGTPSC